ncbi:MAG: CooT family nickel-binding protein [Deltaproteobacteria bacterium]|nr:CooT family nickel-binding protein [Deltaproteobacteria bacterium]
MCEANAYLIKGGEEELVMESVDIVEPEGEDTWRLVGMFGDEKIIKGKVKIMNLVDHKIFFEQKES